MQFAVHLLAVIRALTADRARLALENVALRQQLNVQRRNAKRPKLEDNDRAFWVLMRRLLREWREHLVIVTPEIVIRWHRQGSRYYWGWKSRSKPGRPTIVSEVIHLIRRMSAENVLWGAPHIRDELALLGHDVAESTVNKYMVKRKDREPARQSWRTFLANHMRVSAACDFFTVPTLTFKVLYVFVILSHDRRRILHVNVTRHPTAEWTAQQITEAFPDDRAPRYLHRDRDSTYGDVFRQRVASMSIREVINAKQSPWQNPFVERVIGSIRRECTDHIIALGEGHLRRVLGEYVAYYNSARCHQSLEGNAPEPRSVEDGVGTIHAMPYLGGLHHRYNRAA